MKQIQIFLVETLAELGYSDQGPLTTYGLIGPGDMPDEVVEVLEDAIGEVVNSDEFKEAMEQLGVEDYYRGSEDYQQLMIEEDQRLEEVVPQYVEEDE